MTLEGRPFEPFPWRINGLRAFSGQANRLLTLHNLYIKPSCYNRVSKKAANRPKVPRRMIGRRRGCPPFSIPPGRKRPPIPPGATPLGRLAASPHNGAPSALRLRRARRKRLAEGSKFESLRGGKAPSHSPTRSPRFDRPRDPQASQQLHRRRFYAKEGGRSGWPVERERPSSVKET